MSVYISYNPYTVETKIISNGTIIDSSSELKYVEGKRLQEWIEPHGAWKGIFQELRDELGDDEITLEFTGTLNDFEDLEYAKEHYGGCFEKIELIHLNKETAKDANPESKVEVLKALYQQILDGPIEEFKTNEIKNKFEEALNAKFEIAVVAPFSSGKSTLINAVLGRNLLPAINQATTAVVTRIEADNSKDDFTISATDKYGKVHADNVPATGDVIEDLNYLKDPNDSEGKLSLIETMEIVGPVKTLSTDKLNTVFIDTPGGNNAQNREHEKLMDEIIADEDKSMILYILNATSPTTEDSNTILEKIARSLQKSDKGKQSRDRVLFVANKTDAVDPEKETYESVISKSILPALAEHGVNEPRLFLVSSVVSKLIRMKEIDEVLTRSEKSDALKFVGDFKDCDYRFLPEYASITKSKIKEFRAQADEFAEKANDKNISADEQTYYNMRVAEINSGIPTLEYAINEYIAKYALAMKVKDLHSSFMAHIKERDMTTKFQEKIASSEEDYKKVRAEIADKKRKVDDKEKIKEFMAKVDEIEFNRRPITLKKALFITEMDKLVNGSPQEIKKENAEHKLKGFKIEIEKLATSAEKEISEAFDTGIRQSCEDIVNEYQKYIQKLDEDGSFTIGAFDMKKTVRFSNINKINVNSMLNDSNYTITKEVKEGTRTYEKAGFWSGFKRFFGVSSGWGTEDIMVKRDFVQLNELMNDKVEEIQDNFDNEIEKQIKETEKRVEAIKNETKDKINKINDDVKDMLNEIDKMTANEKEIKEKLEADKENARWVYNFIKKVDGLLKI